MIEKRYHYQDFGEYCTITDTKEHQKTLNDFYNELVNDGYLEDYDNDKEVVLELAEEKYHDYLHDNCLSPIEVIRRLNEQEETIKELETENKQLIKEWFESEKGYIIESYHDNAIRRDEKIQFLKEEFKERFGDVE